MAIPPDIKARLEQLRQEAAIRAELDRRRALAQQNTEAMAQPVSPWNPIPLKKAEGGKADIVEELRKSIPHRPFDPMGELQRNVSKAWETIKGVPGNIQRLAHDPSAYIKSLPAPTGEQIMNMAGPGNVGFAGMMIGPKARTWNASRAEMAQVMENAGKTPQEIWQATGTIKGPDGIWRQEISDAGAKFNMIDDLKKKAEDYKAMIEARKALLAPNKSGQKDFWPKALTEAKKPVREEIAGLKSDLSEIGKNPRTQGVSAEWTLEHPDLYAAYPELANLPVVQNYKLGPQGGSLNTFGGRLADIEVNSVKDPRSVALHEMQHAIQNIEGMAPGASPAMAPYHPEYKTILNRMQDENGIPTAAMAQQRQKGEAAMEWYRRQHGEAEARATQARRDMNEAQRQEKFPYESYDIKPEDFLIREPMTYVAKATGGSVPSQDEMRMAVMAKGGFVNDAHRKWFGDSKVVDKNGHPLVVYHGTSSDFSAFKKRGIRPNFTSPQKHLGFFFTDDAKYAGQYAGRGFDNEDAAIMPVYLSIQNPKYEPISLIDEIEDKWGQQRAKDYVANLKRQGHDGIVFEGRAKMGVIREHVAFDPTQIKSAIGNRGTYDPNDPDITKATGGSVPSMDVMRLAVGGQGPKNWIKGSVEQVIEPLKQDVLNDEGLRNLEARTGAENANAYKAEKAGEYAINQWIQSNLANYIRKQMATHDDPIRKLAEQGIVHIPSEQVGLNRYKANTHRATHGAERFGESEEAKAWEDAADVAMEPMYIRNLHPDYREPWMEKADPKTQIFTPTNDMHAHYLGFDHLVDVLKQDLAEGRIRPEQLNKVSIEQAVRRAHEYDQERKKAMAETALKATEGMPVHKDYGNGYKWIELAMNPDLPEGWSKAPSGAYVDPQGNQSIHHPNYLKLDDALKYEGDTMGHCVGGYTPDVAAGHSRIFSLRDAKNEPHVTVEVKPETNVEGFSPGQIQLLKSHGKYAEKPSIKQIKGKGNAKPKKDYIPYVQDFVKSGQWSDVGDIKNAELRHTRDAFNDNEMKKIQAAGISVPTYATQEEIKSIGNKVWPGMWGDTNYRQGGIISKADGGAIQGNSMTPSLAQMKIALASQNNPTYLRNIGVNEAVDIDPKIYIPPAKSQSSTPAPGGVATPSGMPIGGIDMNKLTPGQQMMPAAQSPQLPDPTAKGAMPGQQASPLPSGFDSGSQQQAAPNTAGGNILQMTPQGRAMAAMSREFPPMPGQTPSNMAKGGLAKADMSVDEMRKAIESNPGGKRMLVKAEGPGGVKGIMVPRHMWEGGAKAEGMKDVNEARAKVYGGEHREPLSIGKIGAIHKQTLAEHFQKPEHEQREAEKEALERLRAAKHIGKNADTLDESEKLDTVRHEHDEKGRTYVGYASKGTAGHSLYTSGSGKDMKHHILNTCPGQTTGCGGGVDENGIVDTKRGTCFAPNAESQYVNAAVRRAAHAQAKHDPAMTRDWILAHTGSLRNAAERADKKNQVTLFRPNVVDETDVSSRYVIRHLNEQRKAKGMPGIVANSYGKTNELHDPENGYHVTHSNVGPKVKKGREITENIGRDKARVRNTILAADNKGDFTNEQGKKTPPKGSYMVTDVKRGSKLSKDMEKAITHAKYWSAGRHEHELTDEEKKEGPEGHYNGAGRKTTEEKAHYGHRTVGGMRFDYQRQHVLHPRLVQVGHNDDGSPHMIPTDSRFKDTDFLPKSRFKTKNGKEAGHILMTTPTESTSNLAHETPFTHHVNQSHIEHALKHNGEYEIDKPEDQIKAKGKEYAAPQPVKFMAEGGAVAGRHPGYGDDDFHAFPESNLAAQRHLAMRRGDDEDRAYHRGSKQRVAIHKDIDTMRLELTKKAK